MKVFYSDQMNAEQGKQSFGGIQSPSARKPREVAKAILAFPEIEIVAPNPVTVDDFKLCHDPAYVDGVLDLTKENGFGSVSKEINDSLFYTTGAMYDAAKAALVQSPTAALVSGFHHAGYSGWKNLGWFCTFNGLMITATKLLQEKLAKNVAIVDCDQHWGNGTDDILKHQPNSSIHHLTFGRYFSRPVHAGMYLQWLKPFGYVESFLKQCQPDIILYQAGADVHVDDPYGGILSTEEMIERDNLMFTMARRLNIPIVWNLAGGYQIDPDGSIQKVIDLHLNTFRACLKVG